MLRGSASLAFVLALGIAAARLGAPSPATPNDLATTGKPNRLMLGAPPPANPAFVGGCTAYKNPTSHLYPYDDNQGAAKKVLDTFFASPNPLLRHVRYAIALAPDPRHTNLSSMFDREMSILLQAAQDESYDYNSSWMPWQAQERQSLNQLGDQQYAAELTEEREACPGVMLFRRRPEGDKQSADDSFGKALVVFVVAEQATGGINEEQWSNAIEWLTSYAFAPDPDDQQSNDGVLRLLGPTFTGSLVSLQRDLSDLYTKKAKGEEEFRKRFPDARILSGSVSGCSAIHWFEYNLSLLSTAANHIYFGSFQENDALHISRFLSYLHKQGTEPNDVAIVSEDETAYGTPTNPLQENCNLGGTGQVYPLQLVYPRDISALRDAYRKEAVFESSELDLKNHQHPILQDVSGEAGSATDITDTVPSLSGGITAVDQEAYLYGVVSFLRIHHTRVLILRCTNPLDFLFLARFFHRAYPEARLVTVGSDLLFRREIDTTEFRGVLSLSSYSLVPRDSHWSKIASEDWKSALHNHLIFQGHLSEGTYIASRYLLQDKMPRDGFPARQAIPLISTDQDHLKPLTMARVIQTEDYAEPFWFAAGDDGASSTGHPPTWLTAVGRDGYWPVAVLKEDPENDSTMVQLKPPAGWPPQSYDLTNARMKFPLPWLVCTLLALLLVCYQFRGVVWGRFETSDGLLSAFYLARNPEQSWLLGISCALAMMLVFEMTAVFFVPANFSLISPDNSAKVAFALALFLIAGMTLALVFRFGEGEDEWIFGLRTAGSYLLCFVLMVSLSVYSFGRLVPENDVALFYRMVHITDGVSPLFPIVLLTLGFYLWNWQVMAGNLMLVEGCPILPPEQALKALDYRISDRLGRNIRDMARPLYIRWNIAAAPVFLIVAVFFCFVLPGSLPLLSMEGKAFSQTFNGLLLVALVLTVAETARLYATWIRLKRLLAALSRLRLRRTIASLRSLEGNSVWSASGNVRRVQYDLFVKQLDAAGQLTLLIETSPYYRCHLQDIVTYGQAFRERSQSPAVGVRWDLAIKSANREPRKIREVLSEGVAEVYEFLGDQWKGELDSLNLKSIQTESEESDLAATPMRLSDSTAVQRAEELVAYHYIAFIQNITARMRTMTLSMVFLFITVCFAISFYPFVPRTEIVLWLVLSLALTGSVVAYVYAGMERDETLSYIANSKPGRLGGEFWLKLSGFLIGPIIGILATQFPSISDNVLRWLQPGLDAIR